MFGFCIFFKLRLAFDVQLTILRMIGFGSEVGLMISDGFCLSRDGCGNAKMIIVIDKESHDYLGKSCTDLVAYFILLGSYKHLELNQSFFV